MPFLIEYLSALHDAAARRRDPHRHARGRVNVGVGDEVVCEIEGIGALVNTIVGDEVFGR